MGHMGDGAHGQWGTWVMGYISIIKQEQDLDCQNLRLRYIFLISEANSQPILM